ncbi:MAG: hypothetical protein ACLFUB_17955 [Cyclobacteriaceae bacterium]
MRFFSLFILFLISIGNSFAIAQNDTTSQSGFRVAGISVAYAGENIIRPGFFMAADMPLMQNRRGEIWLSPGITFFSFQPFYSAWLGGVRATYKYKLGESFSFRPITLAVHYKHKFLSAQVYEEINDSVQKIKDNGYGNLHVLAASGLEYSFSKEGILPLSVFTDFGISAEPYFSVFRFHWELYFGVRYNIIRE